MVYHNSWKTQFCGITHCETNPNSCSCNLFIVSNQKQEKKDKNKIYLIGGGKRGIDTTDWKCKCKEHPWICKPSQALPHCHCHALQWNECPSHSQVCEKKKWFWNNKYFATQSYISFLHMFACLCWYQYFFGPKRTFTHNLDIPMLEIQTRPSILFVLFNASLSLCNSSVAKLFCLSRWLPYGPGILAQQLPTTRTMTGRCMQ